MMENRILKAVFVAGALLCGGMANAAIVHDDGATDFNGTYRSVGTFTKVFNASAGSNSISFDLFGAKSVDGTNSYADVFDIALNGVTVFSGSFSMSGGGSSNVTTNTLGWVWNTVTNPGGLFKGGITSVSGIANLLAGANTFSVTFSSPGPSNGGNQGSKDESWALNKLDVAAVPVPAALPLLALGLGALGAVGARRRKTRAA